MLSLLKKILADEQSCKNIFRLTAILFLVLIINPTQYIPQRALFAQEYGIGGGYISEEIFTYAEYGMIMHPASFEIAPVSEPFLRARTLLYSSHVVQSGDNISTLAINFGLNQDTIISVNGIASSRLLQVGRVLRIPNQDGIFHTVRGEDSIASIAERYNVNIEPIIAANELFSENIVVGTNLFIPGARLDWNRLQEINGDLFIRPIHGAITSFFGWRRNPFNRNLRQFHNGIDIRGSTGTPVRAAMAGRVSSAGWDNVLGNFVVITHHSGYRTLYGHLSAIRTRVGANVAQGERIGDVGNTGQSTGPHLHFSIFRHGVAINPLAFMR